MVRDLSLAGKTRPWSCLLYTSYAKIAEAQGAVGFTVDRIEDIDAVVAEAVKLNKEGKTVVIEMCIRDRYSDFLYCLSIFNQAGIL